MPTRFEAALKTLAPDDRVPYLAHTVASRETLAADRQALRHLGRGDRQDQRSAGGRVAVGEALKIPQTSDQLPDKVLLAAARVDRPAADGGRQPAPDRAPGARGRDA